MTQSTKYVIFIIGNFNSGKSTLIRALTGIGRITHKTFPWHLRRLNNQPIEAFVCVSAVQEMGQKNFPPSAFPKCIEDRYGVKRNDYDLLICPLELKVRNQSQYGYDKYVLNTIQQGFDVRIAIIETKWNGTQANQNQVTGALSFAQQNQLRHILVNASDDPHVTASQIRNSLYP